MSKVAAPVVAFVATVAVVVPAGWHAPEAQLDADGPASRPARRVIHVDGAQITVDVDHRVVDADGIVHVTLAGTAATPREIELDVKWAGTGQTQSRMSRHQSPMTTRETQHVVLEAGPAAGTQTLAFTARRLGDRRQTGSYDLYELEVVPTVEAFQTQPNGAPNRVRVGIAGWSGSAIPVELSAPAITAEGPFEIAVKVTNTSDRALRLWIDFGAPTWLATETRFDYEQDPDYQLQPLDASDEPLAPGAVHVYRYKLLPSRPGLTTFLVLANVHGLDPRYAAMGKVNLDRASMLYGGWGSLDTATFERPSKRHP